MKLFFIFLLYAFALSLGLARAGVRTQSVSARGGARQRSLRVLIIGATGGTGRELVAQALERGYAVTALVRHPSKLNIEHPQLTVMQGDVLDYASIEPAMTGQEAVLSTLGHKRYFYPTRILSEGTRNILRAMGKEGVSRFVCETSLGIGDSAGRMGLYYTFFTIPVILPFYFWDKTRQERIIARSDVEWVIVRPGLLTNGAKRGRYRAGPRVGTYFTTVRISRADVADFMLKQLESDTYLRRATSVAW